MHIWLINAYNCIFGPKAYKSINPLSIIWGISIFLVSFPISCAFILQLFKYRNVSRSTFKRSFFIQLYITAPVQLLYICNFCITFTEELSDLTIMLLSILGFGILIWFFIAELKIIKIETGFSLIKNIGVLILMYLAFSIFAAICLLIMVLTNMGTFQTLVEGLFLDIESPE